VAVARWCIGVLFVVGCATGGDGSKPTEVGPDGSDSGQLASPECGDGLIEGGEVCDDAGESIACDADCTEAECGDGLMNVSAGETCDDSGESIACDVDCTEAECGDGLMNVSAGESCDDGGESLACDTDCTAAECGDGQINITAGEACDDAGESAACDPDCTLTECGDGWMNSSAGEACDDAGESAACDMDCTVAECGDGWMNASAGEACDDAGESAVCDTDCTVAECGDGWMNASAGEACDDAGESAACDTDCTAAECGDGWMNITAGEVCDDAGPSIACDVDCTAAECGDGLINLVAGEVCDDAGESATCDADCTVAECGDGSVNISAGEVCDSAGESSLCDADCTAAECGDGWMNASAGEACDDAGESAACDADCTVAECGDGWLNASAGEACDDGSESAACDTDCTAAVCGDGWMNLTAGEECDDGGESAACDTDCTAAVCGDGVVNLSAGEECDAPEDEDCLPDCTRAVGKCHTGTPWDEIAESLYDYDYDGQLPVLPGDTLEGDWDFPVPEFLVHPIMADERFPDDDVSFDDCEPPDFWDPDKLQLGSFAFPVDEAEDPYCRVRASPVRETDSTLYFSNRARDVNRLPVTGEPTWVRLRFPVPEGHKATSLTYWIDDPRLFGSHPEDCTDDDVDDFGECFKEALEASEVWDEEVPPGIFLLWGRATECEGWEISGPHEPAGIVTWGDPVSYTVDVPETLRDVDELVVSLLVYHQYSGGCFGDYCTRGDRTHSNMGFDGASLLTESAFSPPVEPGIDHPRLFGDNEVWLETNRAFDELPCSGAPDWTEWSQWGELTNIKNYWDHFTKGGSVCLDEVPASLSDIGDAAAYLDGTASESFDVGRATRMLHLIRHERACRSTGLADCYHDEEQVEELVDALISVEMVHLHEIVWSSFGFGFDLFTREPMRVFTLMVDVLWDDLTDEQHAEILDVTGEQVDAYLEHFYVPHWSIYNGNNWTPVLAEAALYWAIVYYHEDPRGPEVAWRALQSLWLHRDTYLDDGVYAEGLLMYSQVSFDPLMISQRLAGHAFGLHLDSVPWERMEGFSSWAMAFMAPDGRTVDFSDSWSKRGWGTFMPLIAHMVDGEAGGVTNEPDPCFAHRFFSNKYYYHGLADPWNIHPALAKDWPAIVGACEATDGMVPDGVELRVWEEGGWGSIRVGHPGSTEIASSGTGDGPSRFKQADQVMFAISAIPSSFSHTELDFGTFVWAAYGNRLIWDMGYGTLHGDRYETIPEHPPDQNPTGHSTLVIPEALRDGDPSTNTSQIDGRDGTITAEVVDGHDILVLDGSPVYGRDDPGYGWLEHFNRRVLPLESGHIILMDDFYVRADRDEASVSEYWYTQPWVDGYDSSACRHQDVWVNRTVTDSVISLTPVCSGLENTTSESAGSIVGLGLNDGHFEEFGEISFVDRLDDLSTKVRMVWQPLEPVRRDLRLFALLAAPGVDALPDGEWAWVDCAWDVCARLTLDGEDAVELGFADDGMGYSLTAVDTL